MYSTSHVSTVEPARVAVNASPVMPIASIVAVLLSVFGGAVGSAFGPAHTLAQQPGFTAPPGQLSRLERVGPDKTLSESELPASLQTFQAQRKDWKSFTTQEVFQATFESAAEPVAVQTPGKPNTTTARPNNIDRSMPVPPSGSVNAETQFSDLVSQQAEQLMGREGTGSSVKIAILLATLSLAPAIVLMTTCYVRIVVVLTLLRQAFGSQQLPSTQILTALSLFVTFLVMAPTWNEIKTEAIEPYSNEEITWQQAWHRGLVPVKAFMCRQIEIAKNEDSVAMFYQYLPQQSGVTPNSIRDVPINVLLPAYLVSELKVAFLLGFQIYLPFLIVDLVVSAVTVSMGMVMLPPTMVSFPLKLILFVLVDGWNLVISMLLQSFGPYG